MVLSALRKLRAGLGRTRESVVGRISAALKREVYLTDDFLEEVEEILISSDVGVDAAVELTDAMVAKGFGDHTALIGNGRRRRL